MTGAVKLYKLINYILSGIICLVFIYSGIFSYEKSNYPIPSFHDQITGESSLSTGLSRSFSAIVRLEFDIAHSFNPYGLRVFLFFLEMLLLRTLFSLIGEKFQKQLKKIVITDASLSGLLFLIHFLPFFRETIY